MGNGLQEWRLVVNVDVEKKKRLTPPQQSQCHVVDQKKDHITSLGSMVKPEMQFSAKLWMNHADMSDSDMDKEIELGILQDEELGRKLAKMVEREDGHDPDWIPDRLRRQQQRRAAEKKCEY